MWEVGCENIDFEARSDRYHVGCEIKIPTSHFFFHAPTSNFALPPTLYFPYARYELLADLSDLVFRKFLVCLPIITLFDVGLS